MSRAGAGCAGVLAAALLLATGAACSSGSGGDPGASTEAMITVVCDKLATAPCAKPETKQSCLDQMHEFLAGAQQTGCTAELDALMSCWNNGTVDCSKYGSPEVMGSQCDSRYQAFYECATGLPGDCEILGTPGPAFTCEVDCQVVTSSCQKASPGGPWSCVCGKGPQTGKTFQATDCSEALIQATDQYCT